ncbi:MAG: FMN-binding protein [Candidatus Omnitrophota bacterium]
MKEIARYGLILGIICFLASGILAAVNAVTEPRIEIEKEKEERLALKEVMPDSGNFEPVSKDGEFLYYKAYDSSGRLNGFVVKSESKGYSSDIEAMAGLGLNLEITNVKILSQNETPGLGTRVTEPKFLGEFKGKDITSLSEVDTITGATISSSSVIRAVQNKIAELKDSLLKEIN